MNYAEAEAFLAGGRDKWSRPLANNTRLERRDSGTIAVKLHATDVVTLRDDGSVTYDTGGWYTVTTKDRINTYGMHCRRVYSHRSTWYVSGVLLRDTDGSLQPDWDVREPFHDGITFGPDGACLNPLSTDAFRASSAREDERRKMKAGIKVYAKLCADRHDPAVLPGGGDCWFCYMHTQAGESLGDATGDTEHLLSHMAEGYAVPSLVWAAIVEAGYPYPGVIYSMGNPEMIARAVRKFLSRRLVLDAAVMR